MMPFSNPTAPILRGVAPAALWLLAACAGVGEAAGAPRSLGEQDPVDRHVTDLAPWLTSTALDAWSVGSASAIGGDPVHGAWSVPEVHPLAPPPAGAHYGVPRSFAIAYDPNRHRAIGYMGDAGTWVLGLERGHERWEPLATGGQSPGSLAGHSAIFDPLGDRLIVFGGWRSNERVRGEVWSLDLTPEPTWSLLVSEGGGGPEARWLHAAIFDAEGRRMYVFGGVAGSQVLDDVWALSLDGVPSWSRIEAAGETPSAREASTAHYDPLRGEMVLVADGSFEVWALSLRGDPAWRQLARPAEFRFPRLSMASVVLDPIRDRLVSVGGSGQMDWFEIGPATWPSVYPLSGEWWDIVYDVAGAPPAPRRQAVAIHDPIGDRMIFFGGVLRSTDFYETVSFDDTWALEFSPEWRWRKLAARPAPRSRYAIALDEADGRLIASGGGLRYDVVLEFRGVRLHWTDATLWSLELEDDRTTWTALAHRDNPRWAERAAFDSRARAFIGLGGYLPSDFSCFTPHGTRIDLPYYTGDAWRFEVAALPPIAVPFSSAVFHEGHHVAVDRLRQRLLVYGGNITTAYCDELFLPRLSTVFLDRLLAIDLAAPFEVETLQVEGPGPGGRTYQHAFYDNDRDRLIFFDGGMGETWVLDLAERLAWTLAARTTRFSTGYRAVYDPVRERIIVIVGGGAVEVWAVGLDGSASRLSPGGATISVGTELQAAYDEVRDRIVIHGPRADQVAYLTFGTPLLRVKVEPQPGLSEGVAGAEGLLAVAILGAKDFDAGTVIPESVRFGGAAAVRPGSGEGLAAARDVDRDGRSDLVLWFRFSEVDVSADRVRLEGLTTNKRTIRGYGTIGPRATRTAAGGPEHGMASEAGALAEIVHGVSATAVAGAAELQASYALPRAGSPVFRLIDVGGRRVREWRPGALGAGRHELRFDVTGLASGVYFLRVQEGTEVVTARIAVVR